MAVEIDADAGPVEARRNLLDMGRFAGAMIALDHHAAVIGKAGQDREGGVVIETIGFVDIRHMLGRLAEGRYLHIAVETEGLLDRNRDVGQLRAPVGRRGFGCHLSLSAYRWRE